MPILIENIFSGYDKRYVLPVKSKEHKNQNQIQQTPVSLWVAIVKFRRYLRSSFGEHTCGNNDSPLCPFRCFYNESITALIFRKKIYLKFLSTLF